MPPPAAHCMQSNIQPRGKIHRGKKGKKGALVACKLKTFVFYTCSLAAMRLVLLLTDLNVMSLGVQNTMKQVVHDLHDAQMSWDFFPQTYDRRLKCHAHCETIEDPNKRKACEKDNCQGFDPENFKFTGDGNEKVNEIRL